MTISQSVFIGLFCASALLLPARYAPAAELNYMTLNGIGQLAVDVEGVRDDYSRFGLKANEIRDRTIAVLREHGIDVVDADTMSQNPDAALLRIDLNAHENLYRFFLYGLTIEIVQKVPLNNPAGGYVSQIVWQKGQTGMVMPTDMRRLNDIASELLVKFLEEHHAQNPQRLSTSH